MLQLGSRRFLVPKVLTNASDTWMVKVAGTARMKHA